MVDALDQQPETLLTLAQRDRGLVAFRAVAHDLGESLVAPFAVDQRLHGVRAPEARAVFADVPAIPVEAPALHRDAHLGGREVGGAVFGSKDHPEVRPDDVAACVAERMLRAWIPGCNPAFRRRREDGEFGHAVAHEA